MHLRRPFASTPAPKPLEIATPCPKSWADMTGGRERRFCEGCQLHVHNLSAMTPREQARLVEQSGGRMCIAYESREDGSRVTHARGGTPLRRLYLAIVTMLGAITSLGTSACSSRQDSTTLGRMTRPPADDKQQSVRNYNGPGLTLGIVAAPTPPMTLGAPMPPATDAHPRMLLGEVPPPPDAGPRVTLGKPVAPTPNANAGGAKKN